MAASVAVFLASLALSVLSSMVLAESIDRLGSRLGISEGLLGILTALGADAPEISAAVTAIQGGRAELGFGVVLGSNIFNLAALLGLSAVVAGRVRVHRRGLAWEGSVALAVTVLVSVLLLGLLGPAATIALLAAVVVPYVAVSSLPPGRVKRLGSAGPARALLASALVEAEGDVRRGQTAPAARRQDVLTIVPALVSVVLGSIGMVNSSVDLGRRWGISQVLIGTLVLASVTGIPNVIAAVRLALRRRGSAVVSEALNSNSVNLMVGIAVPALVVGVASASSATLGSVWWLLAMTAGCLALAGWRRGLRRAGGLAVIAAYLAFVGFLVAG